ncbi:glycosyltransferase family protein [Spirosoma agri]|uniref:YfhO family protein n=1 Tax=Spirosoma agri TaxID=1987381 RepID=A0A6M0IRH1_9BACT|nr:hypothetical protein [Spirosoma agri]NEU70929.1 hypothetical protein [Spirosoma agri]
MNALFFTPTSVETRYNRWLTPTVAVSFFGVLTALYGVFFLRNFSGPLADLHAGDVDQWDYMGYYVARNLSFSPFPHLNWINDQTFYPYGTNHVFQGWAFEQNFWYALCYHFWGNGPWLNIYYLFSLFVLSSGTYMLLRRDYGSLRAAIAGFLVCFFNFYALNKYPGHYAYAMIHWTVLSIITDFLLTRRVVLQEPVPLRFLVFKALLLTLALGHDVGYILGYALSSFALTALFIGILLVKRLLVNAGKPIEQFGRIFAAWRQEIQDRTLLFTGLILSIFSLAFLYVPLLLEVFHQANTFVFKSRFAGGHGWVHPLRLLAPYLPGFNSAIDPLAPYLHDMPEGNGAGSAGWFLVIIGLLGFWKTRRPIRWAYVPIVLFGLVHAAYHPIRLPVLQILPWDRFNRIPSRVTLIYPVILTIFAIHWSGRIRPLLAVSLVLLGLLEAVSVYSFRYQQRPYYFAKSFASYVNRIRQQPGEAILDWPFCVVGGNSTGLSEGLCPLYQHTSTLYALQRFHGKKTIGQYFGRLHPDQVKPFVQASWPVLLNHPDTRDLLYANRLTTCLTAEQWTFFEQFYQYNDFAGINLCTDLLPKSCVAEFYNRFGRPVAATEIPGAGHIVFIPKSDTLRSKQNRQLGQSVHFSCDCSADSANLTKHSLSFPQN